MVCINIWFTDGDTRSVSGQPVTLLGFMEPPPTLNALGKPVARMHSPEIRTPYVRRRSRFFVGCRDCSLEIEAPDRERALVMREDLRKIGGCGD